MNKSVTIDLISKTYTTDSMGQKIATDKSTTVFATLTSISRAEWVSYSQSGRQGLVPSYVASVFMGDYNGESVAEYDGKRYGIYRTYERDDEQVELYLEKKAGNE
jgi:SPP1 family predicted phage head-tail adaptor